MTRSAAAPTVAIVGSGRAGLPKLDRLPVRSVLVGVGPRFLALEERRRIDKIP
jgi:hypothetical protein